MRDAGRDRKIKSGFVASELADDGDSVD